MGFGVDIGIDAQRDGGGAALARGDLRQQFEFRLGLDIDAQDALVHRCGEFVRRLADARKHDLGRRNAGRARTLQFAERHHVGAGAERGEGLDHRLVGIRLHGVADERAHVGERAGEDLVVTRQCRGGIAVERRADLFREVNDVHLLGVEHAVAVCEMVHRRT